MKPVGKRSAGNPHAAFDERGGETERVCVTAPLLDSTLSSLKEGLNKFPATREAQSDSERAVPGHQKKVAVRAVDIASCIVPCRMCLTPVSRLQPFVRPAVR